MSIFLTLAYLFFIGSVLGWVIELLFRNIVHHNKKWVNPGFCTGPYLPIYGFGLCTLYLLASLEKIRGDLEPRRQQDRAVCPDGHRHDPH